MTRDKLAFKIKADFLRALTHPVRLQAIDYLKEGEASVGEMAKKLGIGQSTLSKHLGVLRQAGILQARRDKAMVFYAVSDREIFELLRPVADILRKRLSESGRALARLGRA